MFSHNRLLLIQFSHSAIKDTDNVHSSSTVTRLTHELHLRKTETGHRNREWYVLTNDC